MSDRPGAEAQPLNWHFPRTFWLANGAELFERAAFYGMFIALAYFLTERVGFTDVETGYVAACFASILYLLPTFSGAMADKIGFRRALMLAFALLAVGYFLLGFSPTGVHRLPPKLVAVMALAVIMFGGSIIKPVISGTVAKCSDDAHRARAFSIFYGVVNIGAFFGKTVAKPLRTGFTLGGHHFELGLDYINYYAAVMAACAFILVAIFYRDVDSAGTSKTLDEILEGFAKVLLNFRFMALIVIVAGFWAIQGQLYATMPKYMLRLLGEGSKPEWLANINPAVVIIFVVPVTHLIRHFKPANAIGIGLFIIPFTALVIALSPVLEQATGNSIQITKSWSLHPITLVVIVGIGLQGFAECFLSPKFLEYASKQAPKGEEGLYLGYQHLTTCIAWLFGFILSGHLLDRWCPNPKKLLPEVHEQWLTATTSGGALPEVYAHAHYIWYVFAAIGAAAFVALIIFKMVTNAIDQEREATAG
ncbi:MAG: peptide MFS transporter [bacterium]|nr:peptide MFS transporter [bacterium]